MYCQGCQGFASNGEPEAEIESYDDTTDSTAAIEVKITVPCGNCGGDFKEGYLSTEVDVASHHDDSECKIQDDQGNEFNWDEHSEYITEIKGDRQFEVSEPSLEVSDDYRPSFKLLKKKGPDGQQIRKPVPFRYRRHYYDVTMTMTAACSVCEGVDEISHEDSISAGELEEVG